MGILQYTVDQAGALILAIPSALVIMLSREWFCSRMAGDKEVQPFNEFSLLSFASLSLNGIAPGGILRDQPPAFLRFFYGQIWLLILIVLGCTYVLIKGPAADTFSARFSAVFLTQAWAMLIINFLPLPPFDAAAAYLGPYMQWRAFSIAVTVLSAAALILFSYTFWRSDFLTGKFLIRWLKLT